MVKYYCDMCKNLIMKGNKFTIQTKKENGEPKINHLCSKCKGTVDELCKVYMSTQNMPQDSQEQEETESTTQKYNQKLDLNKPEVNLDKLVDDFPPEPHSTVPIIRLRQVLLCFYDGMSLADISNKLDLDYQRVFKWKSKYASRIIAKRFLAIDDDTVRVIIDSYIKHGLYYEVSNETTEPVERINEVIEYYTGISCNQD